MTYNTRNVGKNKIWIYRKRSDPCSILDDLTKITVSLEKSTLLIYGASKTVKHERNKKKVDFSC